MNTMDQLERRRWLEGLFENQLRALASQYKIKEAIVKSRADLIQELSQIENVEVPKRA